MYVANGDKERRWDDAVEIASEISNISEDFKVEISPPKFRKENSNGEILISIPMNFVARGKLKNNLEKVISFADEFEVRHGNLWAARWINVYSWSDSVRADVVIEEDEL